MSSRLQRGHHHNSLGIVETTSPICKRYKIVVCACELVFLSLSFHFPGQRISRLGLRFLQARHHAGRTRRTHLACRVEADHEDADLLVLAPEREGREGRVDPREGEAHGGRRMVVEMGSVLVGAVVLRVARLCWVVWRARARRRRARGRARRAVLPEMG